MEGRKQWDSEEIQHFSGDWYSAGKAASVTLISCSTDLQMVTVELRIHTEVDEERKPLIS